MRMPARGVVLVLALGLMSSACTGSTSPPSDAPLSTTAAVPTAGVVPSGSAPIGAGLEVVPAVATNVAPSVVTIVTADGNGSGVVFSADGVIVTNEHVVRGNTSVQVVFADGQRVAGTVRATDAVTDVALVHADRRNLPAARFQPTLPVVGSLAG